MWKKVKDLWKNAVIVLLLVNILVLTLMALPANLVAKLPLPAFLQGAATLPEEQNPFTDASEQHTAAAMPTLISLRHSAGQTAVRRSAAALEEAYNRFSPFLRQALASAAEADRYNGGWDFLSFPGVLFSYDGTVPAQAICQWLEGGDGTVEGSWTQYFLSCGSSEVTLYTAAEDTVMHYTTDLNPQDLAELLSLYTPDGSEFAALRENTALAPMTLWETDVTLEGYTAASPVSTQYALELAAALDFNPYGSGIYTDDSGRTVCTEGDRVLTIDPDGSISLQAYAADYTRFTAHSEKPADLIDMAQNLLTQVCGDKTGLAQVLLSSMEEKDGQTVLTYRYFLDGTAVYPTCAEIRFRGNVLAELTMTLYSFGENNTQKFSLMPLAQAAAISETGAYLFPAYHLSSGGVLSAGWCAR